MRSIRAKLLVSIGLAVLLAVGVTLGVGIVLTHRSVEHAILTDLGNQADVVAVREANAAIGQRQELALRAFFRRQGERLLIIPLPLPVTGTAATAALPDAIRSAVDAGQPAEGTTTIAGISAFYVVRPAGDQAVVLLRDTDLGSSDWSPYLGGFLIAGLVGAALAAAATFFLARAISRPVVRVAEASRKVAAGEEPDPVPVQGFDELAILAASFNRMAQQLRSAREAEESFLLSVSHELRTPLTAIKGYGEGLREGAVDSVEAGEVITREEARLERLVVDLLDLARLHRRTFTVRREEVDLAGVAAECARRYEQRAEGFGVGFVVDAERPSPAWGDPDRVLQVVSNLVENALRVTPAGGHVTVRARPGEIAVTDTGPGLAAEDIPRAFERFFLHRQYRGERPVGTGLGLAIVKELTEAMDGTVAVESSPGAGTAFLVRLLLPQRSEGMPSLPVQTVRAESSPARTP
jgi:two-component system, OmpR family, sensor kinase